MKKMAKYTVLIISVVLASGCKNIGSIGDKPEEQYQAYELENPESSLAVVVGVNLDEIEEVIAEKFSNSILGEEKGEFSETYTIKTSDPLYHPNKEIRTKDPLHNPHKWIEKCVSYKLGPISDKRCVKTKNPLYHPREWIVTNDPLYHPSKWIYTSAKVDIGYKAEYEVGLSGEVKFESVANDKLKISIPISADGRAGFRGDLAKIGLVDNKNYEVDLVLEFVVGMKFNSDWCPVLSIDSEIDWRKGPRIEIIGGTWLDFNVAAQIANIGFQPELSKAIKNLIDCESIKKEVAKLSTPSSVPIKTMYGEYSLTVQPVDIYAPTILFDKRNLEITFGTKTKFGIEFGYAPVNNPIPNLAQTSRIDNLIEINLPVTVPYAELNGILESEKQNIENEINEKLAEAKSIPEASIKLRSLEAYPARDRIAMGAEFKLNVGSLFSPSGTIYLTSKPVISDEQVFSLQSVSLSGTFDNPAYASIINVIKDLLESKIETASRIELKGRIEEEKTVILHKIKDQIGKINGIEIDILAPKVILSGELLNIEEGIIKNVSLLTGVSVDVKPLGILKDPKSI